MVMDLPSLDLCELERRVSESWAPGLFGAAGAANGSSSEAAVFTIEESWAYVAGPSINSTVRMTEGFIEAINAWRRVRGNQGG